MLGGNEKLNKIQSQIMDLYAKGATCKEIGGKIAVSEYTVMLVLNSVTKALGANSVAHAAVKYSILLKSE